MPGLLQEPLGRTGYFEPKLPRPLPIIVLLLSVAGVGKDLSKTILLLILHWASGCTSLIPSLPLSEGKQRNAHVAEVSLRGPV